jgi:hypothetical protein
MIKIVTLTPASFQVLLPSVPIPQDGGKHRRQSLTASIHTITKSMSK